MIIPGTNKPPGIKVPAVKTIKIYQVSVKMKRAIHLVLISWFMRALMTPPSVLKNSVA